MKKTDRQHDKMEACEKLATSIVHEFNNVLATITYSAELACYDIPENSPAYKDIVRVLDTGHEAAEFIKEVMEFCRPSKGGFTRLNITKLLKETIDTISESTADSITISSNSYDKELIVTADPDQIKCIISELSNNAINAFEGNPGNITFHIEESLSPDKTPTPEVKLSVLDNGPGIKEESINRIFDPFFTTKPNETKGLGLSRVYSYVKNHNGRIRVESLPEEKTLFKIYIPLDTI